MSQRTRRLVLLLAVLVVLGGTPTVATAQQFGPGSDGTVGGVVSVDAGETYSGDLDAAAGSVVIAGTVEGDVSAAAGSVTVTESGRVTGSLDAAAGSVVIEGVVDGDVTVGAAALELREGSRVGGSLEGGAADVRLDGTVDGDVTVGADTLEVGPTAAIGGSLTYDAEDVSIADDASVTGTVTRDESLSVAGPDVFGSGGGPALPVIPGWVGSIYAGLVNLFLGAILLLAAPTFGRRLVSIGTDQTLKSGGVGLLSVLGIPIVLLLLLVTIVGIPLSLAGLLVFVLLLWITSVYGMIVLGTGTLSLLDYENRWLALLAGVVIVGVLDAVPVVGGLVQVLVLLVGFGAFVLALAERRGGGTETGGFPGNDSAGASGDGSTAVE
jgi:cytoskeletal protein CcmA (bactofilin family)